MAYIIIFSFCLLYAAPQDNLSCLSAWHFHILPPLKKKLQSGKQQQECGHYARIPSYPFASVFQFSAHSPLVQAEFSEEGQKFQRPLGGSRVQLNLNNIFPGAKPTSNESVP